MILYLITAFLIPLSISFEYLTCPATIPECYCRSKYTYFNYIYCEHLGPLERVPLFNASKHEYVEIQIRYDTSISTIQNGSFGSFNVSSIKMQGLEINRIESGAFHGLGGVLRELHLDDNQITEIPANTLNSLINMNYLGLHNNLLTDVPELQRLKKLYQLFLFHNRLKAIKSNAFQTLTKLRGLYLHNNEINTIEEGSFDSLQMLWDVELHHNNIRILPIKLFSNMRNLERLDISHNKIEYLEKEIFNGLMNLNYLDISFNEINNLPESLLKVSPNVFYIDISHNQVDSLSNVMFSNLTKLKNLDISHNELSNLTSDFFIGLKNLEKLNLASNDIKILERGIFRDLKKLSHLNLVNNNMTIITEDIFNDMLNIRYLYLDGNDIFKIHVHAFTGMSKIQTLSLANNNLYMLTEYVFDNFPQLEVLELEGNRIEFVEPWTFRNLTRLRLLNMDRNSLEQIPAMTFEGITNLNTLSLSHNKVSALNKDSFYGLNSVRYLNLQYNHLDDVPGNVLGMFNELIRLNLFSNYIKRVYTDSFHKLNKLEELNLRNNSLVLIFPLTFQHNFKLIKLDLSENAIVNIGQGDIFEGMGNVQDLFLQDNKLEYLTHSAVIKLNKLRLLNLARNPLHCDCSVGYLREVSGLMNVNETLCKTPEKVEGFLFVCAPLNECSDLTVNNTYADVCYDIYWNITTVSPIPSSTEFISTDIKDTTSSKGSSTTSRSSSGSSSVISSTSNPTTTAYFKSTPNILRSTTLFTTTPSAASTTTTATTTLVLTADQLLSLQIKTVKGNNLMLTWTTSESLEVLGFRVSYSKSSDRYNTAFKILSKEDYTFTIKELGYNSEYLVCVEALINSTSSRNVLTSCQTIELTPNTGLSSRTLLTIICVGIVVVVIICFSITCLILQRNYERKKLRNISRATSFVEIRVNGGNNELGGEETTENGQESLTSSTFSLYTNTKLPAGLREGNVNVLYVDHENNTITLSASDLNK